MDYRRDTLAGGYLALGVPEYLVFDPLDAYLGALCRGWRAAGGGIEEWVPTADGRYESRTLGIALRPKGSLLRVLDPAGLPVPFEFEKTRLLTDQALRLGAQAMRLDAQAARIADQETELARLRAELNRRRGTGEPSGDCMERGEIAKAVLIL